MTTISIQSALPLPVFLLTGAIDRERRIVKNSIKATERRIAALSKSLDVDLVKLLEGKVSHTDENDMDLLELEGELAVLHHLKAESAALDAVQICA